MSIEVSNAVWRTSQSVGRARLVLLAIADHQGEIGAWPSIETLAKMVNASERSVQRDINELIQLGELIKHEQAAPSRGQYKANLYWVKLPSVLHLIPGVTDSVSGVTNNDSGVTEKQPGVTELTPGVTAGGVLTLTRTITKPLLKDIHQNDFDLFWKSYPLKVGKTVAKVAFIKAMKSTDADTIIAGVIRYTNDPNRDPAYTKHPATWLNAGCWDDELLPAKLSKGQIKEAAQNVARDRFLNAFSAQPQNNNWGEIL